MLFIILSLFVLGMVQGDPTPPTPPQQYVALINYEIPYFNISETFSTVYDGVAHRQYWNFYNGTDIQINLFDQNTTYQITPVQTQLGCFVYPPQDTLLGGLISLVPDVQPNQGWNYKNSTTYNGIQVNTWVKEIANVSFTNVYTFYTDASSGDPVAIHLHGVDPFFGSHPDNYVYTFLNFSVGIITSVFQEPPMCQNPVNANLPERGMAAEGAQQQLGFLQAHDDEIGFTNFLNKHSKKYETEEERTFRKGLWKENQRFIHHHNYYKEDHGFDVKMNHLGDWTDEEYSRLHGLVQTNAVGQYGELLPLRQGGPPLPPNLNWKAQGVLTEVKDQGNCGSCWTFGTAESIESANAIRNGQLIPLSEQQIVDCAWMPFEDSDYIVDTGCGGGQAWAAMDALINIGSIATEEGYPYMSQNTFCNATQAPSGVLLEKYFNITSFNVLGNDTAMLEAVNIGPVSIAINAAGGGQPFRFYNSGVFSDGDCPGDYDDLDHEVLLVGYGTTNNGTDYWIVRNSWSKLWGEGNETGSGYIWMKRGTDLNTCGVCSQGTLPVVQPSS